MSDHDSARYWLSWLEFGGTVALFLVALGVGYEFIADRLASPLRKKIDAARETEIVRLQNDTMQLTKSIAEANARAAEANKIAEQERLARLQLEAILAPRGLNAEQANDLIDKLKPFAGQKFDLFIYSNDGEVVFFTNVLSNILQLSGWTGQTWSVSGGRTVVGIVVETIDGADQQTNEAANSFVRGLVSAQIGAVGPTPFRKDDVPGALLTGPAWNKNKLSPIRIMVGKKLL